MVLKGWKGERERLRGPEAIKSTVIYFFFMQTPTVAHIRGGFVCVCERVCVYVRESKSFNCFYS